jgi:hypothetical protein
MGRVGEKNVDTPGLRTLDDHRHTSVTQCTITLTRRRPRLASSTGEKAERNHFAARHSVNAFNMQRFLVTAYTISVSPRMSTARTSVFM